MSNMFKIFTCVTCRAERDILVEIEKRLKKEFEKEEKAMLYEKNNPNVINEENETIVVTETDITTETVILSQEEMDKNMETEMKNDARTIAAAHVREWVKVLTEPLEEERIVMDEEDEVLVASWGSSKDVSVLLNNQHYVINTQILSNFFYCFSTDSSIMLSDLLSYCVISCCHCFLIFLFSNDLYNTKFIVFFLPS